MEFTKKNLIGLAVLVVLVLGLAAGTNLVRNQQIFKSRAASEGAMIEFIFPKEGLIVFGNINIQAKLNSDLDINRLKAELKIDGSVDKELQLERVTSDIINITGTWESDKVSVGDHNLEVAIFDQSTNPPSLVGKTDIAIQTTSP